MHLDDLWKNVDSSWQIFDLKRGTSKSKMVTMNQMGIPSFPYDDEEEAVIKDNITDYILYYNIHVQPEK